MWAHLHFFRFVLTVEQWNRSIVVLLTTGIYRITLVDIQNIQRCKHNYMNIVCVCTQYIHIVSNTYHICTYDISINMSQVYNIYNNCRVSLNAPPGCGSPRMGKHARTPTSGSHPLQHLGRHWSNQFPPASLKDSQRTLEKPRGQWKAAPSGQSGH